MSKIRIQCLLAIILLSQIASARFCPFDHQRWNAHVSGVSSSNRRFFRSRTESMISELKAAPEDLVFTTEPADKCPLELSVTGLKLPGNEKYAIVPDGTRCTNTTQRLDGSVKLKLIYRADFQSKGHKTSSFVQHQDFGGCSCWQTDKKQRVLHISCEGMDDIMTSFPKPSEVQFPRLPEFPRFPEFPQFSEFGFPDLPRIQLPGFQRFGFPQPVGWSWPWMQPTILYAVPQPSHQSEKSISSN